MASKLHRLNVSRSKDYRPPVVYVQRHIVEHGVRQLTIKLECPDCPATENDPPAVFVTVDDIQRHLDNKHNAQLVS